MVRVRRGGTAPDGGFALLIVLWCLVLLALVGAQISGAARTQAVLANNLRNSAITEVAGDGAVYDAIFRLLGRADLSSAPQAFRFVQRNVTLEVRVDNLAGHVNPNLVQPPLLRALLLQLGVERQWAESLTDAIMDWSTPGENARPHGAKMREYRAAGRAYGPPGKPFRTIDELGAVLGMTPELLAALRPHLTLWWESDPDPAIADPVVLAALRTLGMDERQPSETLPEAVQVVDITVHAAGPGGSRSTRHAVVELAIRSEQKWRMLLWAGPAT